MGRGLSRRRISKKIDCLIYRLVIYVGGSPRRGLSSLSAPKGGPI